MPQVTVNIWEAFVIFWNRNSKLSKDVRVSRLLFLQCSYVLAVWEFVVMSALTKMIA